MRLRSRFLLASGASTIAIIGAITIATYWIFATAEVGELDRELIARVQHEADTLVHSEGLMTIVHGEQLTMRALDEHVKYAALYDEDGRLIARASTFGATAPARDTLPVKRGEAFDFEFGARELRGVLWPVEDGELLLAASRSHLDDDLAALARLLASLFALGALLSIAGAFLISSRLTRSIEHIADVARTIAGGELATRVQAPQIDGSREVASLASDLNQMIDSLQRSLTAEQRFVSNAAHELRSPLTALRGELELTLRRERDVEEYKRSLREALDNARALQTLTEDLLDLARTRLGPKSGAVATLSDVIDDALRAGVQHNAAQRQIRLEHAAPAVGVKGSRADLSRVFRNLLDNAIEHAPQGTVVRLSAVTHADRVDVAVEDSGPGISEAMMPRLFEPFFRGGEERARSGAGLGLPIAKEIVEKVGGRIRVDSRVSPTRFVVSLPLT